MAMTPDENLGVLEAARAIAAGRPVDWAAIESSADISESLAALLQELRVVENIAELHRSLPDPDSSSPPASDAGTGVSLTTAPPGEGRWGSLRLLERVGEGAFGEVFRAWDARLDREVALKLLKRKGPLEDSVGSTIVDEGRLLARVRHPNVVTVYGADRIEGRVGLWMEFVRGRTLDAVLRDHGPFGPREAALIGLDVCRALSAVHRAGLIHRDIKGQNVMREAGGRLVLMDFGTGREDLGDGRAELAGTPLYVAPEVFAGAPATPRGDIYSVGVLLYHLVTGSYPIKGRTVGDLRDGHAGGRRVWLRDERPDLPDRFVQAVERALEVDPDNRYASVGAMEAALARIVSGDDAASVDLSSSATRAPGARRPERFAIRWWAVSGAVAAVAVVVAALMPASWRDRLLGRPVPSSTQSAAAFADSAATRRVALPEDYSLVGAPSFDGKLFSLVDGGGNVAVMDLATSQVRRVTTDAVFDKNSQFAEFTAISPDDELVAYSWQALDGKNELRVVDVEGKRPRVLVRSDILDEAIPVEWTRDGKSILTTLLQSDRTAQLAFVSVSDGTVHTIKKIDTAIARPRHASVSPFGDFVVYDAPQQPSANARDVFIVRADGTDERRLIEHPANDANPIWTPDGRRVLFLSDRSGTMDLWSVVVDGGVAQGEPKIVHRNMGRMWALGLTDAGSYFYYALVGAVDVYQAELTGGAVKNVATIAPTYAGLNISSLWSPDGRRVAYTSRRGSIGFDRGATTLAIRDVQTGEQHEVTPAMNGGFLIRSWSPDGRSVLVGGTDSAGRQGGFAIDADNGRVVPIAVGQGFPRPDWRPDGRVLYLNRGKGALVARNVETGAEEILEHLKAEGIDVVGDVMGRGFRVSPDGQTLAFTSSTRTGDNAWTRTIAVKPLGDGGTVRELIRVSSSDMVQVQDWTPDGAWVIFTRWIAKPEVPMSLWRVSTNGGDAQPLGLSMVGIRDLSVHPDGTRLTFTAGWPKNELWVMENFLAGK